MVKESLTLKGQEITSLNRSNRLEHASNKTLSTASAIKAFIDGLLQVFPTGTVGRTDSVLSRNPQTGTLELTPAFSLSQLIETILIQRQLLEVNVVCATELQSGVTDSLSVTVTSADNITISQRCAGNQYLRMYGYGRPPFTVSFFCVNSSPGRNYMVVTDDQYIDDPTLGVRVVGGYNFFEKWANYGDTIQYVAKNIRHQFDIKFNNLSQGPPTYRDPNGRRELSIVNNTRNFFPVIYGLGSGAITVSPGETATYNEYLLQRISITPVRLGLWEYGGYSNAGYIPSKLHCWLYKNDVLWTEDEIEQPGSEALRYTFDSSWIKVKIVLENVD
ncbi:hypothetical protein ACE38W_04065 [Chitinophaga sp. Hz27]|uniref:hypothetical protein n=1 Tax=Chitinophaga sp. Hz27 TaxID=3347169 RepID=UPI0035D9ADFE